MMEEAAFSLDIRK